MQHIQQLKEAIAEEMRGEFENRLGEIIEKEKA